MANKEKSPIICTSHMETPELRAQGDSDNVDLKLTPKGTGALDVGGIILHKAEAGIVAGATQTQAGATLIAACINEIGTVGTIGDGVRLPDVKAGMRVEIINNGANAVKVYPFLGDDAGAGVDQPLTLDAGEAEEFTSYDATNWNRVSTTEVFHGEMCDSQNTDVFGISAVGDHICYHTNGMSGDSDGGWTFDAGGAGTPVAVASIADGGGGTSIDVTCSVPHGVVAGDVLSISNTGDANYDKVHVVASIGSSTVFNVVATFTATGTGTMDHAATMTVDGGSGGKYEMNWHASATSATNNETMDFVLYIGSVRQDKTETRRKFGTATDFGSFGGGGLITVADGDKVSMTIANISSAADLTMRNFNIIAIRL